MPHQGHHHHGPQNANRESNTTNLGDKRRQQFLLKDGRCIRKHPKVCLHKKVSFLLRGLLLIGHEQRCQGCWVKPTRLFLQIPRGLIAKGTLRR